MKIKDFQQCHYHTKLYKLKIPKTNMKKSIPTFLTIFMASIVSAGPVEGVEQLLRGLGQVIFLIIKFLSDTILDINSVDEFLFAKILLFTITLLVVYTVIKKNPILGDNNLIHWIISVSISILSIRFIPDEFIQAILLQYSTLGVGLTIFLPFAIFFFFVHQSGFGPMGRKMGWAVYGSSFIAMWAFAYNDIGQAGYLYGIAITLIMISFLFDKYIHAQFGLSEWKEVRSNIKDTARVKALHDFRELEEAEAAGYYSGHKAAYEKRKKHLEKIIKKNS